MNKPQLKLITLGEKIRIRGLVQGVGFRPTVYRIAQQLNLNGEVLNDASGVKIIALASPSLVDQFIAQIQAECPPLARIDSIERSPLDSDKEYSDFTICASQHGVVSTGIIPDAATCPECLNDIQNPDNPRFEYAFTNCTHCGPRLSIVDQIPYDRAYTSMKYFALCPSCTQEYQNPSDRRFHAQPNACPNCGPFLRITDANGIAIQSDDPLKSAAKLITQGKILAIKRVGGFQLACDAGNDQAVLTLRQRKHRPSKALALMAGSTQQVEQYCELSLQERMALESSAAPIVILKKRSGDQRLSEKLAPLQNSLGFMLPYSPLHHILMKYLDGPIVLTSGNASEEPQCIDNQQAIDKLGHIADFFILHNRDIINRIDDSVIRIMNDQPHYYRRARGYAPTPLPMPPEFNLESSILALGGELKNTFCLLKNQQATLSQHMGNLENLHTYQDYLSNIELYQRLFEFEADIIAIDKHPEYLSSKLGRHWAAKKNVPLIEIQHHHAHIASCMADNQWESSAGPVIGVALDGLGYGDDGTVWGGEFIVADYTQYKRYACLKPVPLPGAVKAMIEPWRNLYAQITREQNWQNILQLYPELPFVQHLQQQPLSMLDKMMANQLNTPLSSSCGRLFDAFAAAMNICSQKISYEGQAAIELESLITPHFLKLARPYPYVITSGELSHIDLSPMWPELFKDMQSKTNRAMMSANFHLTLAQIIKDVVLNIKQTTGINNVALCGGVFQNPTLLQMTTDLLSQHSLNTLYHQQVPSNDGGLALGQAAIAAARTNTGDFII